MINGANGVFRFAGRGCPSAAATFGAGGETGALAGARLVDPDSEPGANSPVYFCAGWAKLARAPDLRKPISGRAAGEDGGETALHRQLRAIGRYSSDVDWPQCRSAPRLVPYAGDDAIGAGGFRGRDRLSGGVSGRHGGRRGGGARCVAALLPAKRDPRIPAHSRDSNLMPRLAAHTAVTAVTAEEET